MPVTLLDISASKPKKVRRPKYSGPVGITRTFDDGTVEATFANGMRMRRKPYSCSGCGESQVRPNLNSYDSRLINLGVCAGCFETEQAEWRAARDEERAMRNAQSPDGRRRRHIAQVLATPAWRDREAIKRIYADAKQITELTGIEHQVDHIYPIQSKYGCGLHVHQNLTIITKFENISKNNKFPLHDSPALK